jgi:hypothetical protein
LKYQHTSNFLPAPPMPALHYGTSYLPAQERTSQTQTTSMFKPPSPAQRTRNGSW